MVRELFSAVDGPHTSSADSRLCFDHPCLMSGIVVIVVVVRSNAGKHTIKLQIWDTAGEERYAHVSVLEMLA